VAAALGTTVYPRMRLGVGGGKPDPNWVLGRFTKEEKPVLEKMVADACDAVRGWMDDGIEKCMTRYNRRKDQ
jgi:PTH1 family peptidyl-tRNA hydrolase